MTCGLTFRTKRMITTCIGEIVHGRTFLPICRNCRRQRDALAVLCETPAMLQLDLTTLVVDSYDNGIAFFVDKLGFILESDADLGAGKRWVVVRPAPTSGGLLLAKASTEDQTMAIGRQTGGRVAFFLHTDDLNRQVALWKSRGVRFVEEPRTEPYGKVVVFLDDFGNRWDLIEPIANPRM
jgi:catechol 2,3-dioxygenase-like lactoylglutathione lyase family enzyme